jgi:hypothetical protein
MKITCGGAGVKDAKGCAEKIFSVIEILTRSLRCATRRAKKGRQKKAGSLRSG